VALCERFAIALRLAFPGSRAPVPQAALRDLAAGGATDEADLSGSGIRRAWQCLRGLRDGFTTALATVSARAA
ncbi:unnamed protein product, partial [Prorocentrum cordatum]